jgi:hypothetical protein
VGGAFGIESFFHDVKKRRVEPTYDPGELLSI